MLEDIKPRLGELQEKLDQMEQSLEVPAKEEKIAELEYKMGEPTFWTFQKLKPEKWKSYRYAMTSPSCLWTLWL